MAERLDRFAFAAILQDTQRQYDGEVCVAQLSKALYALPAGWWIKSPKDQEQAWEVLIQLIGFVTINRDKYSGWYHPKTPSVKADSSHEPNVESNVDHKDWRGYVNDEPHIMLGKMVFFAHKAAQHLAAYGGEKWQSYLQHHYTDWEETISWLNQIKIYKSDLLLNEL